MSTRLVLLEDFAERSLSRLLQELGVHFEPQASLQEVFSGDNTNSNKKNVLILSGQHLNAAQALEPGRFRLLNFSAILRPSCFARGRVRQKTFDACQNGSEAGWKSSGF